MKVRNFPQIRLGLSLALSVGLAFAVLPWVAIPRTVAQQDRLLQQRNGNTPAAAGKRLALVMGNGAYANAPTLKNPPNDARDMTEALRQLGFEVTSGIDLNQRQMKTMIRTFGQQLKAGGQGVFYYGGMASSPRGATT